MLRLAVAALAFLALGNRPSVPVAQQGIGLEWLTMLPGTWTVESVLADGRHRPGGSYLFTTPFTNGNVVEVAIRDLEGRVTAKGAVGIADVTGRRLFYMAAGPSLAPTAITGLAEDATRTIVWTLEPALGSQHPYNQGLVTSRVRVISPEAFVWFAPGHWEVHFRKAP